MANNVIDLEERLPELQRKRKRKTTIKFTVVLLVLLVLFALFAYMQSSYSKIKTIKIDGAELLTKETYLALLSFEKGDSMWGMPIKESKATIEKEDIVKSVTIKKKWPRTVVVTVKEWRNVAYMFKEASYVGVLENGTFYKQEGLLPIDAPLIQGFDDKEERKALTEQLAQLPSEVLQLISQIANNKTETSPYLVQLFMNDSFEVYAMTPTLADKLKYYPEIVAQIPVGEKGVIDLEVGAYYRPYSEQYRTVDEQIPEEPLLEEPLLEESEQVNPTRAEDNQQEEGVDES